MPALPDHAGEAGHASSKVHRIDIPQTKVGDTTFLWAPLASANNHYFHNILTNRYPTGEANRASLPGGVPFGKLPASPHHVFQRLPKKVALEAGLDIEKDGIHALGPCNHNHVWEPMKFDYPPKSLTADKIYAKYRFVITMENSEEIGYLTEKLSNSLAGGGVPVYFGDSKAAMRVFDYRSYVDMKRILVEANRQPNIEYITESDWEMVSRFIRSRQGQGAIQFVPIGQRPGVPGAGVCRKTSKIAPRWARRTPPRTTRPTSPAMTCPSRSRWNAR